MNAPQQPSDKMRALTQALSIKNVQQASPLLGCAKAKEQKMKTSVFLTAGLSKETDKNTYGHLYNFLVCLTPKQRVFWGEFHDWLARWYANPPLTHD